MHDKLTKELGVTVDMEGSPQVCVMLELVLVLVLLLVAVLVGDSVADAPKCAPCNALSDRTGKWVQGITCFRN